MTVLRKTTAEHPAAAAERLQALLSKNQRMYERHYQASVLQYAIPYYK